MFYHIDYWDPLKLSVCSPLLTFEQEGIFIVPHLLWHGPSDFRSHTEVRPIKSPCTTSMACWWPILTLTLTKHYYVVWHNSSNASNEPKQNVFRKQTNWLEIGVPDNNKISSSGKKERKGKYLISPEEIKHRKIRVVIELSVKLSSLVKDLNWQLSLLTWLHHL